MEIFKIENHTPFSLALLILGSLLILAGPRKWILVTLLTGSVFVSNAPHVVIFGQTFMVHRFLLVCAWIRVLSKGEGRSLTWVPLDKAFALFCVWTLIGDTLLL